MRTRLPRPDRFLEVPKEDCEMAHLYVGPSKVELPTWHGQFVVIWRDGRYYIDPDERAERQWQAAYAREWQMGIVKEL